MELLMVCLFLGASLAFLTGIINCPHCDYEEHVATSDIKEFNYNFEDVTAEVVDKYHVPRKRRVITSGRVLVPIYQNEIYTLKIRHDLDGKTIDVGKSTYEKYAIGDKISVRKVYNDGRETVKTFRIGWK